MTVVLGITGSIGMGKSTVAAQFAQFGAKVIDSDGLVHQLLSPKGAAFQAVVEHFPDALENGSVNRRLLGKIVFADTSRLATLEAILHPLVRQRNQWHIVQARYQRFPLLVLDIPLLFETGAETLCNAVVVVTAPPAIQKWRVMQRKGMTEEKWQQILAAQLSDAEKRRRADFIVQTGLGKYHSRKQVERIIRHVRPSVIPA
jgi:dephospho-CoA kinase